MKISATKILIILILILTVFSIGRALSIRIMPYAFNLAMQIVILVLILFLKWQYFNKEDDNVLILPVKLFLIWNVISIARALFIADDYWAWKNLTTQSIVLLLPIIVYVATNKNFLQQLLSFWLKYALVIFLFFIPLIVDTGIYGIYLAPIVLLLLLFPFLTSKWKIIALFITVVVFVFGLENRSDLIKFGLASLFGLLYYFRFMIRDSFIKFMHAFFIVIPIVLLILGLTGTFNVFHMKDYIKGNYSLNSGKTKQHRANSLTADTRTFIYDETIHSALKHGYVIQGRTPARGYDSQSFGSFQKWDLGTGRMERNRSEVGILNIFTWGGLVGVVLYFLVFLMASYLAIYRSNSFQMKIIGLFVAFRWSYAFVEDITLFDIQYLTLWLLISICYSTEFRKMNDVEFNKWVKDLLPKFVYGKKLIY